MWTGIAAITVIVATIAAAIYVSFNRRVIYGPAPAEPAPAASGQRQRTDLRAARPAPAHRPARRSAETEQKRGEAISNDVSGFVMPDNDAEMVAIRAIAKLIEADLVTETMALSTVFGVKAGGSKRYKEVQAKLKAAQAEQGESTC